MVATDLCRRVSFDPALFDFGRRLRISSASGRDERGRPTWLWSRRVFSLLGVLAISLILFLAVALSARLILGR